MREIELRAFDIKNGCIYKSVFISGINSAVCYLTEDDFKNEKYASYLGLGRLEIMQYTGLKDKNGVKIFEGDILTTSDYPHIDEGKQNYVSIVEWCFAGFHTVYKLVNKDKRGISDGINSPLEEGEEFEVIGNIHQNPELLKEVK